jgi:two-component system, chemotaxis family, response regulator WspF
MRIAIVNDQKIAIEALCRILNSMRHHQLAWIAYDGAEALRRCARDRPDLILMDLVMPGMSGVEVTRRIMEQSPCAILIVTANVMSSTSPVFDALGAGALDAVDLPLDEGLAASDVQALVKKINTIAKLVRTEAGTAPGPVRPPVRQPAGDLVIIGASTGGPPALATILGPLEPDFPASIIVVQHLDAKFAGGFVDWLAQRTLLRVRTAVQGDMTETGAVLVAVSEDHLVLGEDLKLTYIPIPRDALHRPSVDIFFNSVARYWPKPSVAVLLTGMGRDGAQGLLQLRRASWHTIAQDSQSSAVYGMPKAAAELDAAVEILALDQIAAALMKRFHTDKTGRLRHEQPVH